MTIYSLVLRPHPRRLANVRAGGYRHAWDTMPIMERGVVRSELRDRVAEKNPDLPIATIGRIVLQLFDLITERLTTGGRVELRGFGVFTTRSRSGRIARNPRDGAPATVPPKRAVHFKPAKLMSQVIQPN